MRRPRLEFALIFVIVAAAALAGVSYVRWHRVTAERSTPNPPSPVAGLFVPASVMRVTVSAGGRQAPWLTTDAELRSSVEMWKRMHLAGWGGVPVPLRYDSLDRMLMRYRNILNNPHAWDAMTLLDWDTVPQPIRTVAYRRMTAYWSGFYDVGATYGLDPAVVAQTLAAIVMSESWFDHRAQSINRDGTLDVGLGQASPYARQRLRELHASGRVDASLSEDDYFDPWKATRFVALWMALMLDETRGDLDLAVRAYNRGRADAGDRLGAEYLSVVQRRLARFIRNHDAPSSWTYLWRRSREIIEDNRQRD